MRSWSWYWRRRSRLSRTSSFSFWFSAMTSSHSPAISWRKVRTSDSSRPRKTFSNSRRWMSRGVYFMAPPSVPNGLFDHRLDTPQKQHGDHDIQTESTDGGYDGADGVQDGVGDGVQHTYPAVPGVDGEPGDQSRGDQQPTEQGQGVVGDGEEKRHGQDPGNPIIITGSEGSTCALASPVTAPSAVRASWPRKWARLSPPGGTMCTSSAPACRRGWWASRTASPSTRSGPVPTPCSRTPPIPSPWARRWPTWPNTTGWTSSTPTMPFPMPWQPCWRGWPSRASRW